MAEDKLLQQKEALERMKGELARLNEAFDQAKKALGVKGDLPQAQDEEVPPALREALQKSVERAQEAGRSAVKEMQGQCASRPAGRARRGALSI